MLRGQNIARIFPKVIKNWENSSPPAAGGVCADTILHDENKKLSLSSRGGMCLAQFGEQAGRNEMLFLLVRDVIECSDPLLQPAEVSQGSTPGSFHAPSSPNSQGRQQRRAQAAEMIHGKICQKSDDSQAAEPLTHPSPFPLPFQQHSLPHP